MSGGPWSPLVGAPPCAQPEAAAYDHRWLIVDDAGKWLGARHAPQLNAVAVELRAGFLVLRAPGMLRLDIPLDVIEDDESVCFQAQVGDQSVNVVDEGELAAAWISNVVGRRSAIMKVHPDAALPDWPGL